ncbi:MAG: fatty-acyl-CoA synthase [Paracoccaceae bacterium]|jgi:fatty-acyl-CoA synthase
MTQTLPAWLDGLSARHGRQTALISGEVRVSFEDLSERSRSIAAGLHRRGIGSGDTVAVWLLNDADWLAVFFACARLGAIVVAVNTRFRATELIDMISRTRPKAIFYRSTLGSVSFAALITEAIGAVSAPPILEIVVGSDAGSSPRPNPGAISLDDLSDQPEVSVSAGLSPEDGAIMFATSGTTSAPKFVLHPHRSIVDHAGDVAADFFMADPDAVMLQALPYCGVFGFCQAMAALAAGRPSVLMDIFDPGAAGRLIADHRVTHFNATDEMLTALVGASPPEMHESLRLIGAASFNRGPETLAALAADHGLPIVGLYGMSEVQALYARRDLGDPPATRFQGGGRPVSRAAAVRVRDPETGEVLMAGQSGELELRGPSILKTYFGDAAATSIGMTEDGYVRTGDLGYLDEGNAFTFESRMGDALRLGGFLVNPDEISAFIESIDGISACVVVGVRAEGRQRAAAFVTIRQLSAFDSTSVLARCCDGLAPFKVPVILHALDEFPVADGPNGVKIQRGELRRIANELLER